MALVVEKVKFLSKYGKIGPLVRVDHSPVENITGFAIGIPSKLKNLCRIIVMG
jgi:hypothetical protein